MFYFTEKALILPYALAALSGAFNAAYFWSYRAGSRRRRVGALALFLVNAGIAAEGFYLTVAGLVEGRAAESMLPVLWLGVRLLLCAGALSITFLIVKRLCSKSPREK